MKSSAPVAEAATRPSKGAAPSPVAVSASVRPPVPGVAAGTASRTSEKAAAAPVAKVAAPKPAANPAPNPSPAPKARTAPAAPSAGTVLLRLLATVHSHESARDAATALATELAVTFLCERVAIGLRDGSSIELLALSHQTLEKEKLALLQLITSAMEEAAFQRASVNFPLAHANDRRIVLAHTELSLRNGNQAIATVPLARNGKVYGALTFERTHARPFTAGELAFFEHVAAFMGPVIELKRDGNLPWWRAARQRVRQWVSRWSVKSRGFQAAAIGAFVALIALAWLPVEYRVGAPARLEGSVQRVMAAPSDGFIKQVHVRPGDEVKAEQLLVELSDEEFALERQRRESEVVQLQSALGDALAKHDNSQIGVLSAKVQEAKAQLDLVTQQLQHTQVQAPFDGVVIKGDLSQLVGSPVRQGDTLFVLSPSNEHRVILEVDERDIADVALEQEGSLTLSAYPSSALPLRVKRITPMANAKDGRNYFEVEAALGDAPQTLRPGLQGVAKVDAGQRALLWVVGHTAWNWLRLALWSAIG